MADPRNFLLNSDYPLDKVVFTTEGSFTVGIGGLTSVNIPHGLSYAPLPKGSWSTSSTWTVVYEESSGPIAPPNTYSPILYGFTTVSDSTNVTVTANNYISGAPVTIYYRVYCMEPSNSSSTSEHTSSFGTNFILNTDYNYTKLIDADYHDFPDTFGTSSVSVLSHSIGSIPQVLFWIERSGIVRQITQSFYESGITAQPTSTNVTFTSKDSVAARVHWRVYADE